MAEAADQTIPDRTELHAIERPWCRLPKFGILLREFLTVAPDEYFLTNRRDS